MLFSSELIETLSFYTEKVWTDLKIFLLSGTHLDIFIPKPDG
jgi:hypothetical protein